MWPTFWLSHEWHCVLYQSVTSHVLQLHVGAADNLDVANLGVSNGHRFIEDTSNPFFLLRIIFLFIGC